jgi:hypothetical protein
MGAIGEIVTPKTPADWKGGQFSLRCERVHIAKADQYFMAFLCISDIIANRMFATLRHCSIEGIEIGVLAPP